ncbi:IS3 family transposase [Keratinibaculum paraultunense]|uniref:IS3 family transposase n=1 Tax=Keratinibaculum paraultunense TaxID=1278232 RepID=UPI001045C545|nr:IS3 family transposase [Keratinibaculum paraultunense]QQY79233.1 transposase [Keratinibaculum paraultunense]
MKTERKKENEILIKEIMDLYEEVNGIYGYRKITMNLNHRLNKNYNHKRIYRLMKLAGLKSVIRKKKKRYIKSTPQFVSENILNQEFWDKGSDPLSQIDPLSHPLYKQTHIRFI